jgi:predicted amidophosphoribosyltransferase
MKFHAQQHRIWHCIDGLPMRPVSDFFRSCAECGSGRFPLDVLCEECWRRLEPSRLAHVAREGEPLELYSYLLWRDDSVGNLLRSLKGPNHVSAFRRLAFEFSNERSRLSRPGEIVFIPAPPRTPGAIDHAHLWAEELSRYWGAPVLACLKRVEGSEQKRLSAVDRNKKRLELMKNVEGPNCGRNRIIFCDDVYTTGATARAAFRALGKPSAFEVWTVACRPRLFGV